MSAELSQLREEHLVFIGVCLGMIVLGLTAIVALVMIQWRKARRTKLSFSLKREMLERGLSVDQIERLLKAERPTLLHRWCGALAEAVERVIGSCRRLLAGCIAAHHRGKLQRAAVEFSFKRNVIERGFTVDEVERLVAVRPSSSGTFTKVKEPLSGVAVQTGEACRRGFRRLQSGLQELLAPR